MPTDHGRGRRLWIQLLRVGLAAGRGSRGGRLRFVALVLASMALVTTAHAAVVAASAYAGRDHRDQARGPILAKSNGKNAAFRWAESTDAVGGKQHWVIYLEPMSASAEPPPGLPRWPAPGEAFLSPGLLKAGNGAHIRQRYGRVVGEIAKDGLASPGERLVYTRPLTAPEGKNAKALWYTGSGFGHPWGIGEATDPSPLPQVILAIAALVGMPALALLVVAARCGSAARDRRNQLLMALGAGWPHRALVTTGESAAASALGTVLGTVAVLPMLATDVPLPITGYVLSAADLREKSALLAVSALLSFAVAVFLVVALNRAGSVAQSTSPRRFRERVPRLRLVLFGVAVATVVVSQYFGGRTGLFLFVAGTLGVWATLPSVGARASQWLGAKMAGLGNRRGNPGLLVGGRWTGAHPGVIVRVATAMIISLGLIGQLQVWNSRLGEPARDARATQARIGDQVLIVESRDITPGRWRDFTSALPPQANAITLNMSGGDKRSVTLISPCATFQRFQTPCPSKALPVPSSSKNPQIRELLSWYGGENMSVQDGNHPAGKRSGPETIAIITGDHVDALYRTGVERAAYTTLNTPSISRLGDDWALGAEDRASLGHWLLLFGIAGMTLLILAAIVSAAAEFLRFGPALAPLTALTDNPGIYGRIAFWHLTVPMAMSTVIAAVITVWHSLFFISVIQEGEVSWNAMGGSVVGGILFALATGVLGGWAARRTSREWRPTAD
ncbi:permease [Actinomadura logoneensis]|uniref:Permease n=1 Tax=Actinomadura logoneensis TaxID=2293572 RepID=A0A372JMH3_9ACTN|nr:permease [Actinomadura logoneensis]RFU41215.1 permease [Actinomadura logoneensis]